MENEFLSVAEAATSLGVHRTRINQLIDDGTLPAMRIGRAYVVKASDLELVRERPSVGRPKKAEPGEEIEQAATNGSKKRSSKKAGKKAAKKAGKR